MNDQLQYDATGINLTEASEGGTLVAYKDVRGVWTNGVGHTGSDVHPGQVITPAQKTAWLLQDIATAVAAVKRLVTVTLTQDQFDALVDFTFNEGQGNFSSSTLLRLVNAENFKAADAEFARWNLAGGQVYAALTRRRAAEAALFAST